MSVERAWSRGRLAVSASGASRQGPAERRIGAVLRGRYQIVGVIGAGGMATVYLANHRNGHRVALKILRPELSGHPLHRERFVREAYVANSLDHPGAVRVIDDDIAEDGSPFLVMELLQGETLEARHRRCGPLDAREVLAIGHALCDVLIRAHAAGVVHRDIKPENIFLTTRGELKVLDFGIARVQQEGRESATRTGHMMGTPAYMPPEQALGRRHAIDGRSDLWSVGATMFTLLSGRAVHQADTPEEMVVRSATVPAPGLRTVAPDVPAPVAAIVDTALAFAQADRFADAAAMQAAIAAAHLQIFSVPVGATALPAGLATPVAVARRLDAETFAAETLASDPGRADTAAGSPQATASDSLDGGSLPPWTRAGADTGQVLPFATASPHTDSSHPPRTRAPSDTGRVLPFAMLGAHTDASLPRPAPPLDGETRLDGPSPVAELHATPSAQPHPETTPNPAPRRGRRLAALAALVGLGMLAAIAARAVASAGCTRNADCAGAPGPAICRADQGRCVALAREHCRVLASDDALARDDTLWIGAMYPIRDTSMDYGADAARCVELAQRDFNDLAGGLPSARPGAPARPIGVVLCDDTSDHAAIATHLVDDVGVPAILGFGRSKEVLELARDHFVPKGVLALASNTAAMLSSIPHPPGEPRLVYRMTTSATMMAPPTAALLRHVVEPTLRAADGPVGPAGTLRIAILRTANASGTSHTDALHSALASSRPAGAREEVRAFIVDNDSLGDAAFPAAAAAVAAYAPHVLLDGGATTRIVGDVEAAWTTGPRPYYAYGPVDTDVLRAAQRADPGFAARYRTIGTRDNPTIDKVTAHYLAAFPGEDGTNPTPYDAFYVLAYAALALGDEPVTGRALARAIARLVPPGEPIEVGPAGIYPALKVLARGGSVDLRGTLTTLDFDPETGDATADFAVFCMRPEAATTFESGLWYDATTRSLVGTPRCP